MKNPKPTVVMPSIRRITVDDVYANLRTKMKGIISSPTSTRMARQNAANVLNMPKGQFISSGKFGTPCSACHAICFVVVAFDNQFTLCDSCLALAAQIMSGGGTNASYINHSTRLQ